MPKNQRPGLGFDSRYDKYSWGEIADAQNQWDLLNEQEKANKLAEQRLQQEKELAQEKLKQDRENAEKIARATRQAEEDKFNNEVALEKMRQLHDEKMRYMQLCDNVGANYDDIVDFYNEFIESDSTEIAEMNEKIKRKKQEIEYQKTRKPSLNKALNDYNSQINAVKGKNKKLLNDYSRKGIIGKLFDRSTKQKVEDNKKVIEGIEKQKQQRADEFNKNKNLLEKEYEDRLNVLNSELEELYKKLNDENKNYINYKNRLTEEFKEFRENHYNIEFEMLFKKLGLDFGNVNTVKEGTVNDYNRFIMNVVSGNFFNNAIQGEKQKICNEVNVDYSIIKEFYNSMTDIKKIAEDKYKDWHEVRLPAFVKEIEDNQPLIRANKNIQDCYDNGIRIFPDILSKYSFLAKNDIENLDDCPDDIKEIIQNRLDEFKEFRYSHYNQDFEDVLKDLNLQYINELDMNNITGSGTIEDYIDYMKNYKNREENI